MPLTPNHPPGRSSRKALAHGRDIHLLRNQGHSFEAIRGALAAAGVFVSKSTVFRELARHRSRTISVGSDSESRGASPKTPQLSTPPILTDPDAGGFSHTSHASHSHGRRSGKEIAEAFVKSRVTNSLIRRQEER